MSKQTSPSHYASTLENKETGIRGFVSCTSTSFSLSSKLPIHGTGIVVSRRPCNLRDSDDRHGQRWKATANENRRVEGCSINIKITPAGNIGIDTPVSSTFFRGGSGAYRAFIKRVLSQRDYVYVQCFFSFFLLVFINVSLSLTHTHTHIHFVSFGAQYDSIHVRCTLFAKKATKGEG